MLELILIMLVVASMAKRKGRRRFRRYLRGSIDFLLSLSGLAAKSATSSNVGDTVTERAWCSSVVCTYDVIGGTAAIDDGPILVGVAHSDYTTAEIEAWIESTESWEEEDLVGQEVAKRKIRRVGVLGIGDTTTQAKVLNDGKPIRTKCGWMLGTGQTVKFWAYNIGASAFATTDPLFHVSGHANLWPA